MQSRVKPVAPVLKTDNNRPAHKPLGTSDRKQVPNHFNNVFKAALERS